MSLYMKCRAALIAAFFALTLSAMCISLNGCWGCSDKQIEQAGRAADNAAEDLERGLTAKQRDAINKVNQDLKAAIDGIQTSDSSEDPRAQFRAAYTKMVEVDRADCPPDFRRQYEIVLTSFRELNDALSDIPADDDDKLAYWLKQFDSSNPDFEEKEPIRIAQQKYQNLMYQLTELKAVAHKYGANLD